MEQRIENVAAPVQSVTEKINLALLGDALSDEAAASVEARWHAGVEDTIDAVSLNWQGKLVQSFFDKLRSMCL